MRGLMRGAHGGAHETHAAAGWRIRSEICLESWWELRTIMLCSVAGCCGMLMMMAPTLHTAALLVLMPRCALYSACDLAMLHFTTVLQGTAAGQCPAPPNWAALAHGLLGYAAMQLLSIGGYRTNSN